MATATVAETARRRSATGHIHAARLERSARLQRVLYQLMCAQALADWWMTTREIMQQAQVCAVSACIAELRQRGYVIDCRRIGRVWSYRLSHA